MWDLDFFGPGKLAQLNHGDAACGKATEIGKRIKGFERPGDDFLQRLGVVGKPNRRSRTGRRLLPDFFREDRGAVPVLGENDATG